MTHVVVAVVTGFGPFGDRHSHVNPSWEAVKALPDTITVADGECVVKVYKFELPVEYGAVQRLAPELHARHRPDIVFHCGVGKSHMYCLESVAHSKGYVRPDNIGCTGSNDCDADTLTVDVDLLQALTHDLNATNPPDPVVISDDAGRFLCEFTLFQSLNLARRSRRPLSLFFHVPPGHVEASTELIKRSLVYLARHVGTL
ncbi:Pyroglutamyl-peptidase I [Plasmodiophora brassicae]|uniref:Pyroglutamyl-peptidase I n=1 Tax=Plasmodiophora brassicae TaxID=37360 RepID=A0A0G4J259_PLABS|nr:hypothetical protein PBRA_002060 [Plasmodiophora brassicae]